MKKMQRRGKVDKDGKKAKDGEKSKSSDGKESFEGWFQSKISLSWGGGGGYIAQSSCPQAPSLKPDSAEIFSLYCLVGE